MAQPRRFNQYGATSYGNIPSAAMIDQIIQSELAAAQQDMYRNNELKRARKLERDQIRSAEEAASAAKTQGMVGTAAQLGTTAAGIAGKDNIVGAVKGAASTVKDTGTNLYNKAAETTGLFSPVITPSYSADIATYAPAESMASEVMGTPEIASYVPEVYTATGPTTAGYPTVAGEGMVQGINSTVPTAAGEVAGETASGLAAEASGGLGVTTGEAAGEALSSIATPLSYAAPYYALAKGGGMAINAITNNNPWMKETPLGLLGKTLDEPLAVEDALGRALTEHGVGNENIWEGLNNANPLEVGGWLKNTKGKALSAATGGLSAVNQLGRGLAQEVGMSQSDADLVADIASGGVTKVAREIEDACIIVTACTDRHSPEVNLAREYRDKFLTHEQLSGYYLLAEKIVPILERNEKVRKTCKKWLVDRLVDYGEYKLGKKANRPKWSSYVVSKLFLATITAIGFIVPDYQRASREAY